MAIKERKMDFCPPQLRFADFMPQNPRLSFLKGKWTLFLQILRLCIHQKIIPDYEKGKIICAYYRWDKRHWL